MIYTSVITTHNMQCLGLCLLGHCQPSQPILCCALQQRAQPCALPHVLLPASCIPAPIHAYFISGNAITSLMLALLVSSITSRSTPMPRPPQGGMPYSNAVRKSSSKTTS